MSHLPYALDQGSHLLILLFIIFQKYLDTVFSKAWQANQPSPQRHEFVYKASGYDVMRPMDMAMDHEHLIISTVVQIKDPEASHNSRTKIMSLGTDILTLFGF